MCYLATQSDTKIGDTAPLKFSYAENYVSINEPVAIFFGTGGYKSICRKWKKIIVKVEYDKLCQIC